MLIKVCELKVGLFIVLGITGKLEQLRALGNVIYLGGLVSIILYSYLSGDGYDLKLDPVAN